MSGTLPPRRLGIAGLGAVGRTVAAHVDADLPAYSVAAVSARRRGRASEFIDGLGADPRIVELTELAEHADIVVEAAPAEHLRDLATPVLSQGKELVVLSCGALLEAWDLVDLAEQHGARIHIPTGALLGLDGVLGAAEGQLTSVRMVTRKPVRGLLGAPFLTERGIDLTGASEPVQLFEGTVREAIKGFPANLNVAVALSLAGLGPDATHLEVWADPDLDRNTHQIEVEADSASMAFSIANVPTEENPRTGRITALSVIALLRKLTSPLPVGT